MLKRNFAVMSSDNPQELFYQLHSDKAEEHYFPLI